MGDRRHLTPFEIALMEMGVCEVPGPGTNARINEYHASCGTAYDDETPWCSSFVNWCLEKCRDEGAGTNRSNARSWNHWGEKIEHPRRGDLVVFWRGSPAGWMGHVGFFVTFSEDGTQVLVLGGNQKNRVGMNWYGLNRVLSYRAVEV